MEHLRHYGPNGKLEPELATSVTQPNAATYVYHLRHGVTFWDGIEMTSADVVNSINYLRAPGSAPGSISPASRASRRPTGTP
jgi:peptide/nickel transport system substrate-binding protein